MEVKEVNKKTDAVKEQKKRQKENNIDWVSQIKQKRLSILTFCMILGVFLLLFLTFRTFYLSSRLENYANNAKNGDRSINMSEGGLKAQERNEKNKAELQKSNLINFDSYAIVDFGNNIKVSVEVAENEVQRQQGLMYREEMAENHGMLFIFPTESRYTFWMKNTYISLDIIFLNQDLEIVTIHENTKTNQTEERYQASENSLYVVEVNAGFTYKNGIEVGDRVHIQNL